MADLNGDGKPDVLVAFDDQIAWYANQGNGRFSDRKRIADEGGIGVNAMDVTGNGRLDVLSTSAETVGWYENQGNGRFSDRRGIAPDVRVADRVYAGDFDRDGGRDVVYNAPGTTTIAWHENQGDGQFSAQKVITEREGAGNDIDVADLNADGKDDVLSAGAHDKIAWYNVEEGGALKTVLYYTLVGRVFLWSYHFSDEMPITNLPVSEYPTSIRAADLNGDGRPDALWGSSEQIAWHRNEGNGRFSPAQGIAEQRGEIVETADLTGNGLPDVLSVDFVDGDIADNRILWYKNTGDGRFADPKTLTTAVKRVQSLHTADLNGDGIVDVLSTSTVMYEGEEGTPKVAWYDGSCLAGE